MLPNSGLNIQNEPVFWSLPSGKTVCWSLREFNECPVGEIDMLGSQQLDQAYLAIAKQFQFDCLGVTSELAIAELRADPGTETEKSN